MDKWLEYEVSHLSESLLKPCHMTIPERVWTENPCSTGYRSARFGAADLCRPTEKYLISKQGKDIADLYVLAQTFKLSLILDHT